MAQTSAILRYMSKELFGIVESELVFKKVLLLDSLQGSQLLKIEKVLEAV